MCVVDLWTEERSGRALLNPLLEEISWDWLSAEWSATAQSISF